MRKFLVVSFTSGQKYTGGLQCSKRNFESIQTLFGNENVNSYIIEPYTGIDSLRTKIKRIRDIMYGSMGGLDKHKTTEIIKLIEKENVTDLFIDSSLLGLLAKRIKNKFPKIRVTTFFHNFEKGFVKDYISVNKDYLRIYWAILTERNERAAIKYSDTIIALNERDSNSIESYYKRKPDILIPITLKSNNIHIDKIPSTNKEALFIGSYFFGNVQGIKWFCNEVLPYVNIHLTIVGASMDKLKNEIPESEKLTILSDVPNLTPFYEKSDFIILPILSGSGMKVKTAESLMHGKYILGTDEAFRGYNITEKEGKHCNTAEEFIKAINEINLPYKFNMFSRQLFEKNYSFESSLNRFSDILNV